MNMTALSPWAEVDFSEARGINPRPDSLAGKTVGMFSHFKEHSPIMLRELEKLLSRRLPDTRFSHLQYPRDTKEILNDPAFDSKLKDWLNTVDVVVAAYGDAGSCAMFHAYNTAYIEKLGVPAAMLVKRDLMTAAQRGAAARHVPALRFVPCDMLDLSMLPVLDEAVLDEMMHPFLPAVVDGLIDALTGPLAPGEQEAPARGGDWANIEVKGDFRQINDAFYRYGWTNGTPVIPPTREAVDEMLTGTDLPAEHLVGCIPPMLGKATVEKIAINGVMAGCLPTYMPVLIAAVKGMLDPRIHLEGWTCSVSSWFPLINIGGPIRKALNMNSGGAFLSPYFKAHAAIARAVSYMIMNIGGVRPRLEDMSEMGHIGRAGIVVAENEEESPWEPLHCDYGFDRGDSCITLFWPQDMNTMNASTPQGLLENMCGLDVMGWDPGAVFVISPNAAQKLGQLGWTRRRVLEYVVEYNRHPGSEVMLRWLRGNNHLPGTADLPMSPAHSTRRFWSTDHLLMIVGGSRYGHSLVAFTGGGDHGGPSCTKIGLPKNWDELVKKYDSAVPEYINY